MGEVDFKILYALVMSFQTVMDLHHVMFMGTFQVRKHVLQSSFSRQLREILLEQFINTRVQYVSVICESLIRFGQICVCSVHISLGTILTSFCLTSIMVMK